MTTPHYPEAVEVRPEPEADWLSSAVRAWNRFWFRPADPLPLGVMRLFAGAVILYIHLIYSLDLQALVGKEAWLDKAPLDYLRHKAPFSPPVMDWGEGVQAQKPLAEGMPL